MTITRSNVRLEKVEVGDAGRRIDNFLLSRLKDTPKSLVYKLVRSGQVRVNGGRVKPDYRLSETDEVRIPPVLIDTGESPATIPAAKIAQLEQAIRYEDDDFIVLDKPAGLACHGGSGLRYGVIEIARAMRPKITRLDLAHRLDRATSGCLVLCKGIAPLRKFHDGLRENELNKRYIALLRGRIAPDLGRICLPLSNTRGMDGEQRTVADDAGKLSETIIEARQLCGPHTLVELRLVTGRMHQIRAHASAIGHPVAGDLRYGDTEFNRALTKLGLRRLFLHAASLEFPARDSRVRVEIGLPDELDLVLQQLGTSVS